MAFILGVILGTIFGIVQVSAPPGLADEILVTAYGAALILVTIAFVRSAMSGLVSGVAAMIFLSTTEFVYYSLTYGSGIAAGLMPYSAVFLPRLVVLPLSGLLGGLIAGELLGPKSRAPKSQKARVQSRAQKTKGERKKERKAVPRDPSLRSGGPPDGR